MRRLTPAGILLIVVNIGFIVAGALLIKFTGDLNNNGWLDALNETEYKSTVSTLITAVKCLGIASIVLALIGIVGAVAHSRVFLMIYSTLMVLAMIVFGVIGGTAFSFTSKMKTWKSSEYPAESSESEFAPKFNQIYCYAQGAWFCNNATTAEVVTIFLPTLSSSVVSLLPNVTGLNALCATNSVSSVSGMDTVCKACSQATKYAKFDKILTWAEEKCPRTSTTSTWCASYLESGTLGAVYVDSPYKQCRGSFLSIVISWGNSLTTMGLLAAVAAAFLVGLTCFARRARPSAHAENYKA